MMKSWIRAGLLTGFCALGLLLLRPLFAEGAPRIRDVAMAGTLYTMAFAVRVSL